jgi:hypothetical protein
MSMKKKTETVTVSEPENQIQIGETTMLGDLMKVVIEQLKVMPKPWDALSEKEQQEFLNRVELQVADAIRQAVRIITARGQTNVPATVDSVTFKDGVKAVLKLVSLTEGAIDLAKAEGSIVSIIIPNTDDLIGGDDGKPKADPDQRAMELGDEYIDQ